MLPSVENVENVDLVETSQPCKPREPRPLTHSKGTIYRYFPDRLYGFIKPDCGGLDVWFHKKNCVPGYTPAEGDKVIYLTRLGDRGLYALEVDQLTTKLFPVIMSKALNGDPGAIEFLQQPGLYDQLYNRTNGS